MNLIDLYGSPPPGGASPWDILTTEPGLTYKADDGIDHTVAQDFGPRDGRWVAVESDTSDRVYVYGHPESEALDVALETPIARDGRWVTGDNLDGDVAAPAPHYEFGWRYLVPDEDIDAERLEEGAYHISDDGSVYDLGTGYGPVWVDHVPPVGAIARLICAFLAHETEVEVEDRGAGTDVRIGALSFTAPRLVLGEHTPRTIKALITHLTDEVHEFDSVDHYPSPDRAKYPPVWRILYPVYDGFWVWFRRALAAYGFDDFSCRSNSDCLTFYSDGATCSGQEG